MDQEARLNYLINYLQSENPYANIRFDSRDSIEQKIAVFRGLSNIRQALPVKDAFIDVQDAFLTEWNQDRKITRVKDLEPIFPQLYLWQGDITSLAVDGIVNAANSRLLGCMQANHNCIDNIIHSRAGVQLRLACAELIKEQGRMEAVGKAKITKAYNLPASYVIHTVGPFIDERGLTPLREDLLASSYRSSLALADEHGLQSIAFCCISTGEFNFPNKRAAEIAIATVKAYLKSTQSKLEVIFNVFKDKDLHIYSSLFEQER